MPLDRSRPNLGFPEQPPRVDMEISLLTIGSCGVIFSLIGAARGIRSLILGASFPGTLFISIVGLAISCGLLRIVIPWAIQSKKAMNAWYIRWYTWQDEQKEVL